MTGRYLNSSWKTESSTVESPRARLRAATCPGGRLYNRDPKAPQTIVTTDAAGPAAASAGYEDHVTKPGFANAQQVKKPWQGRTDEIQGCAEFEQRGRVAARVGGNLDSGV